MTKEEAVVELAKELSEVICEKYLREYKDQVSTLTKRVEELEGLLIDIIEGETATSSKDKIRLYRNGVKGYW